MKRATSFVGLLVLFLLVLAPHISFAAEESEGFWCTWFGWAARTVGLCEMASPPQVVEVVTHDSDVISAVSGMRSDDAEYALAVETTESASNQSAVNAVTNEYITIQQNGVTEDRVQQVIDSLITFVNARMEVEERQSINLPGPDDGTEYATREYILKSLDKVYDQIGDSNNSSDTVTIQADFNSPTITNGSLAGLTYVSGSLGVGTSSPSEVLSVDGAIYLTEQTPANTANRLYNFGGDLYWNGSLVTSSSTGNWTAAAGDAFRLTGGVGIGTSTMSETFNVDGTALFTGTTTAPLVDAGGQVCNVEAYGAVGDNSTLNDAAIAAAIADCPEGGVVFFPMGEFRIANPIVLDKPVTLRGSYSPRWSYSSTPRSSIRADFGSFSGVAMVHVRDRTISGEPEDNNGGRLEHLSLDGGSAGVSVDGIYFEGLVRDWKLTDVDISQTTGNGFEAAVGTGSGNPRGFTIRGLSIYSADGHGFRATALNDSYIDDLLAVGNSLRGIYVSSMGETKVANSRAVFNGLSGLYIDGSSNNGGITFTDFSTDRNDRHGVRISASGTSTIIFNGLLTRRDGPNTSGGGETPYAGVAIIGSPADKVAPVFISGLGQTVGVDDVGAPPLSPLTGVRVTNAEYVKIDGQLWGVNESWRDDGGNDFFVIEDDAILKTGTAGAQELFTNARKWQSTSTDELIFGNNVHIGSTTDTRLLNIVAPSEVGMRMRDMTNDVTMDMRVEDFQAFIGTFSNHQMRFQTNNTSRLTIDINGNIGIGTTSPTHKLTVAGDIGPDADDTYTLGAVGSDWECLYYDGGTQGTCASDERLKSDIETLTFTDTADDTNTALVKLSQLQLKSFSYHEAPGSQYHGLIAQDVLEVAPELVVEDSDGFLAVKYGDIQWLVVEAVQELWQRITGNTDRIEQLEERILQLEQELDVESLEVESEEEFEEEGDDTEQEEERDGNDDAEEEEESNESEEVSTDTASSSAETEVQIDDKKEAELPEQSETQVAVEEDDNDVTEDGEEVSGEESQAGGEETESSEDAEEPAVEEVSDIESAASEADQDEESPVPPVDEVSVE